MTSEKGVLDALTKVMDPELGISLVDLGLIYGVDIKGKKVTVRMTFTTPACPMLRHMAASVEEAVKKLDDVEEVDVQLVWDPPWTPERMSGEGKKKLGLQ